MLDIPTNIVYLSPRMVNGEDQMSVTRERLQELMSYDAETGEFRHQQMRRGVRYGSLAGTISSSDGLRYIGIDGRKYAAQRLAWLYVRGEWPDTEVGFIDPSLVSPLREKFENLAVTVVGNLTATELRVIFDYDRDTGIFKYRASRRGIVVGRRAGSVDPNGYRYIGVRGTFYTAQRLAWLYEYGEWPDSDVRFKNGDKDDCRIDNLFRPVGHATIPELKRAYDRADRAANPEKHRGYNLKKDFGITPERYAEMLLAQNGVCAVCGQPETAIRNGRVKQLAVDHDHETESIRGLLCNTCNPMIGYAKDDPARLRAAADYLERWAEKLANVIPLRSEAS